MRTANPSLRGARGDAAIQAYESVMQNPVKWLFC